MTIFRKLLNQPVALRTRSKNPDVVGPLIHKRKIKKWVAATHLRNRISNDELSDCLKQINRKRRSIRSSTFPNFLIRKGNEFEEEVINYIGNHHPVSYISEWYNKQNVEKTIAIMKTGVPIIYSACLSNPINKTYGVADLLVRSDYLKTLINSVDIEDEELNIPAPKLDLPYHYLVIDIKFFTLSLKSDGKHILNNDKTRSYKSQLCVYNDAIGQIQGYTPRYSFLLGRCSKYTKKDVTYKTDSCLDKLGIVDFHEVDRFCIEQTKDAVNWYREVLDNSINWNLEEMIGKDIFPNMKNNSFDYSKEKQKLAKDIGEITMLWRCGIKHRENAISNGIYSWKDKRCNADILGVSESYKDGVNSIIEVNRNPDTIILPNKIKNNLYGWKDYEPNEMFVDFETISDICEDFEKMPIKENFNLIYMIGVGWKEGPRWNHKTFVCSSLTIENECGIMNDFCNFIQSRGNPKLYYWDAEERFWNSSRKNHGNFILMEETRGYPLEWIDMSEIFRKEPIAIKGGFGFGLKSIVEGMNKHKMIDISMESDCKDGMMAMVKSWYSYQNNSSPAYSPILKDVSKYNEFDCKSLQKIIYYLRNDMCDDYNTQEEIKEEDDDYEMKEEDDYEIELANLEEEIDAELAIKTFE